MRWVPVLQRLFGALWFWRLQLRWVRKVLLHGLRIFGALSFLLLCCLGLRALLLLGRWFGLSWWFPLEVVSKKRCI